MTQHPDPPVDVRLHLRDGRVIPVDCVYRGRSRDGVAEWEILSAHAMPGAIARVTVGVLPARTALVFGAGGAR